MRLFAVLALAFGVVSSPVDAQTDGNSWRARVDSLVNAGDTSAALAVLDQAVRQDRNDGAAWHRRGVLAWRLSRSARRLVLMKNQRDISLIRMADTSLRLAVYYAPDSGRFALDLGRYYLNSDLVTLRLQALKQINHALDLARKYNDADLTAEVADELGMVHWRRYEAVANRRSLTGGSAIDVEHLLAERHAAKNFLENFTEVPLKEQSGELDYLKASDLFTEAMNANPSYELAIKHAFMALAEQKQWEALDGAAERRLAAAPWDPTALLARALANHRLDREGAATLYFDSALTHLSAADRARYTNYSRLLRVSDSVRFASLATSQRGDSADAYWAMSDPLTLTPDNEHRLEFMARVAYSELRWTSEDYDLKGADTDRGQIYIRYGPPPVIAAFAPSTGGGNVCTEQDVVMGGCGGGNGAGFGTVIWYYPIENVHFVFKAPPSFGVAHFQPAYVAVAEQSREKVPVSWSNLRIDREMDSISVQVARFRAPSDSTDLALFANIPVQHMVAGVDLANGSLVTAFTIYDAFMHRMVRDSSRQIVTFARPDAASRRTWRRRMAPRDYLSYRVEAWQPDAERGARALGNTVLPLERGFGLSDLVLADRVAPRGDGTAERWSDLLISPNAGTVHGNQAIGVMWETYDLTPKDNVDKYKVELTITVLEVTRGQSLIAKIVGGAADLVGLSAKGDDRVALSYTTSKPSRPVQLDYLSLELGGAPAGKYRLAVQVTDLANGHQSTRTREFTVVP